VSQLIYVTARLPYGDGEPFVATEVRALERRGWDVTVVPVRSGGDVVHADAAGLRTAAVPLASPTVAGAALAEAGSRPLKTLAALAGFVRGRPGVLLKNVAVFPKGLWLARMARRLDARHIHAHWAGTSATMAMVAGQVSGIPWSLTAHRWDIRENNLLRRKAREACFVRAISEHGARELGELVGEPGWSPWVLHMGVQVPSASLPNAPLPSPLRVLAAARLVEKKGHVHLIEALRLLRERGVPVRVDLAGDGPLAAMLERRAVEAGLEEELDFLGTVSHEDLLAGLASGRWDAAVLPSVVTESGELEGIPVSLVEAMACGLPVVGTDTGGIPELLRDDAGILIPPGNPEALANAVEALVEDPSLRARLGSTARRRVEEEFAADLVAGELDGRFRRCYEVAPNSSA
jgi:colanic acid/amylovoran biosynthesis glycosyltransferase